jgi:hypothetical protein
VTRFWKYIKRSATGCADRIGIRSENREQFQDDPKLLESLEKEGKKVDMLKVMVSFLSAYYVSTIMLCSLSISHHLILQINNLIFFLQYWVLNSGPC